MSGGGSIPRQGNRVRPERDELVAQLVEWRVKRGMSQDELSKRAGTSQSAISDFETGLVSPNLRTLRKIMDALEVDLNVVDVLLPTVCHCPPCTGREGGDPVVAKIVAKIYG